MTASKTPATDTLGDHLTKLAEDVVKDILLRNSDANPHSTDRPSLATKMEAIKVVGNFYIATRKVGGMGVPGSLDPDDPDKPSRGSFGALKGKLTNRGGKG